MHSCIAVSKVYRFGNIAKATSSKIRAINFSTAVASESRGSSDGNVHARSKNKSVSINIPTKIERSDIDILKALASTVGRDYTAPHYRYHDDPYLIPVSNLSKRSFALSKESGKKAAKWILQEHSELFQHHVADPPIEAYFPKPSYTADNEVDVPTLQSCIEDLHLIEAVNVYKILKSKGKEIDKGTKQALLELLCYYNETDPIDEEWVEERWYKSGMIARDKHKNSWKDRETAEQIFQELEPQDSAAYCALIRGRAKYYQSEKAWQLYKEAESKGLPIDLETYNSLLKIVNFLREGSEMRWQLTEEILNEIERSRLKPNLSTMNAVLETLSTYGNVRQGKSLSLSVLSDFKRLGVEPSLASYYNVLITHCKERGPTSTILFDIVAELENKSFQIQDLKDTFFFVTAMDICRNHLNDLDLAQKIDDLLHVGNNYDLIGDSFKESIYYRHYVSLKCNYEEFDTFMQFYDKIVPNVYTPEPAIMEEIVSSLHLNGAIGYLERLWSDMVVFDHTQRENLLALTLQTMSVNFPEPDISNYAHLSKTFGEIGWKIWEIIELWDEDKPRTVNWSGRMLGDLLIVQVKSGRYSDASEVMKKLLRPSQNVLGIPQLESLEVFLEAAMQRQDAAMSLLCIQFMNDTGFPEVVELAQAVAEKVSMDSSQIARLSNIVGFDVLTAKRISSGTTKTSKTSKEAEL